MTKKSLDTRFQKGPYIEACQNNAIDELEEIPGERIAKEDLHYTP